MKWFKQTGHLLSIWVVGAGMAGTPAWSQTNAPSTGTNIQPRMPSLITNFTQDENSLDREYPLQISPLRNARFAHFYSAELSLLKTVDFNSLSHEDQIDYLLLKHLIISDQHQIALENQQREQMQPLLPFSATIDQLLEKERLMQRPDAEQDAQLLSSMVKQLKAAEKQFDPFSHPAPGATEAAAAPRLKIDPVVANRAAQATLEYQHALSFWFSQYNGYDPRFTWWNVLPYNSANQALTEYRDFLKEKLVGIKADDSTTIIGDPLGRQALLQELYDNMIPYTPEELIAIAQTEYDWCLKQMIQASREMGYGDNWRAAVEKVKQMHVQPGEQPELIRKLVLEGRDFAVNNNLVTVPPLADETWTMIMMTPKRQLVNPFFTGGDELSVSFPTNTMTYKQREMSMRGNNIPFSRATAFHEMIPGHFFQFYMMARYRPYRQAFQTPFWIEGNAFWWEMLYYSMGYDQTPAERIGALVWRMHRSARVIFTMNFHLGKWTPQQCVQYLIDNVGFDSENDLAEVRRSFDGSVEPLYQSAYLLGALQFRELHHELVDSHKMTNREFHDTILHEGSMPIELLRADMENLQLTPDFHTTWKFYGDHPTHP
ncbi:MAG: DUF885 family protein [Acidobacteriaceae bacterium]